MSDQNESRVKTHVVRNVKTEDFHVKYQPRQQQPQQPPNGGDSSKKD
ncbi:hypothetical protein OGW02_18330 [Citrobacter sp. Ce105]|jgi:hypothetical protein|nr:hypothetical protein [Citrobacter sp. Ce105]MDM3291604.1 hypothetical protein [Citrobacter sp. Ce105]